jgi:hypothetical protein
VPSVPCKRLGIWMASHYFACSWLTTLSDIQFLTLRIHSSSFSKTGLMFICLNTNGKTKDPEPICSRKTPDLFFSPFLHAYNFDSLVPFPNTWTLVTFSKGPCKHLPEKWKFLLPFSHNLKVIWRQPISTYIFQQNIYIFFRNGILNENCHKKN